MGVVPLLVTRPGPADGEEVDLHESCQLKGCAHNRRPEHTVFVAAAEDVFVTDVALLCSLARLSLVVPHSM